MTTTTTFDPLTTPDALALLRALDEEDDGVLPILADMLEEANDPRAAGFRLASAYNPDRYVGDSGWEGNSHLWWVGETLYRGACVPEPAASRLRGRVPDWNSSQRAYPSRSAAFLDLAEALSVEASSHNEETDDDRT